MKVVGYVKTTWEEQLRGVHADSKQKKLEEFAEYAGLDLTRIYSDEAMSPERSTLGGITAVLDAMFENWEGVLVLSPASLTPIAKGNTLDPIKELKARGKSVIVVGEKVPGHVRETKSAKQARKVKRHPSQPGRSDNEVARRLLAGRVSGALNGRHQSGPAPYGYRREKINGSTVLVPDENEAPIVARIFNDYLRTRSLKKVVLFLNESGCRTRRNLSWSRTAVSWILKNDTYIGRVHFGDINTKGVHKPLIDKKTFEAAKAMLVENDKRAAAAS